ncbi:arabinosyltransferase B/arabinosyltransferase C [Pseudonocardia ammonioxydans]|uniref:Arabinosyltransferase B/arabinosyltransferase C n=1 Tax=Pseudonocardia ammonioxydans TaxID=260086 RepID=A0A1I4WQF9_PSUAM|nr:arabinosyltransferase domain-containing protein [Pseudonocardia ammonioxydans]SFN16084.1 arabinosyltransferase B/arabinosyltransferase C [Pseudonocardia ammonioxydans]
MTAAPARRGWLLLLLGGLTCLLGLAAALAPVDADDPVVTWPAPGAEAGAASSTVLPLSPYRPLQLDATIPCAAAAAVPDGDVLRTVPADVEDPATAPGLSATVADGTFTIRSGAEVLHAGPVEDGCTYRVTADADGTVLTRDGATVAERPDLAPPHVAELSSAVAGPAADGLAVQLHTDARYESSPSPLKVGLLVAHLIALAATLAVALRSWTGSRRILAVAPRPGVADAVVLVVTLAWAVLGPVNIDDSWYMLMARQGADTGSIGNAIYQFNVTEAPFATGPYLMQAWGALAGWGLLPMRVVPVVLGLGTWVLLRLTLIALADRAGARTGVVAALAVAHLAWFLPYGLSLRPEPAGTLAAAGVLFLVAAARRTGAVGLLAPATAVAVLGVTTAPAALVAAAPLLLALPQVWWHLVHSRWPGRLATVAVALAAASVVVPLGLADQTLGDVRESIAVHRWYYFQYSWWQEHVHYANLLASDEQGAWGRRLPVLLTVAVLVLGTVRLATRRGTGGPLGRALGFALAVTALGLVAVAASPTKWVNHFGAVAAPATLLLGIALARGPLPRRAPARLVAVGTAVLGVVAAVIYAGPNLWRPFADWGQPFGNHSVLDAPIHQQVLAPHLGPLYLRSPVLWLLVAAAGLWWAHRRRRAGHPSGPGPDGAVLRTAAAGGVALMLAVFVLAPVQQAPGPSVASMNLAALGGRPCGLADAVTVQVPDGPAAPASGPAELTGVMREGPPPDRSARPGPLWHTDDAGAGTLRTGWFPVSEGTPAVLVPATGDLRSGQSLVVEAATGPPGAPGDTARIPLELPGEKTAEWTELPADLTGAGIGVTQVRLVVEDTLTDPDTWLGVGAPLPARERPAAEVVAGDPVFADQVSALLWPCAEQIVVRHGIAEAPQWRLRVGDGLEGATEDNAFFVGNGGVLAGIDRTASFDELPSRLEPAPGRAMRDWGHVERVRYDHPTGGYDLRVGTERRWGWERLPTLAEKEYTGRDFLG